MAYLRQIGERQRVLRASRDTRTVEGLARHIFSAEAAVLSGIEEGSFDWEKSDAEIGLLDWETLLEHGSGLEQRLPASLVEDRWLTGRPGGSGLSRREWLWQTVEHEIHHRAQISTILRAHGVVPPTLYA